jgi:hypothetical protein
VAPIRWNGAMKQGKFIIEAGDLLLIFIAPQIRDKP